MTESLASSGDAGAGGPGVFFAPATGVVLRARPVEA